MGWLESRKWRMECRFGESLQQATLPHVRHRRRWTHHDPMRRQSSHPFGVPGSTSLIWTMCSHWVPGQFSPRPKRTTCAPRNRSKLVMGCAIWDTLPVMRPRLATHATVDLEQDPLILPSSAFYRVGENEFGVPGLIAIESVGPFVPVQAIGPFFMIHDSYWQPGFGIGHHPHRTNDRLFYIVRGRVEHDDALNGIKGTMDEGDLGRLTEGVRGMLHQEWNGAPGQISHAFILVYRPDV